MAIHDPQASRMRLLVWPREHGAWGILGVPLITGAAAGLVHSARWVPLLLFTVTALALFCLRTPAESLLGTTPMRAQTREEWRTVAIFLSVWATVVILALNVLLWRGQNAGLFAVGAAAGLLFVAQSLVRRWGRQGRMAAQMIGALGLTSTAACAYYVVAQRWDAMAVALWLANWMFAVNQIHFVQMRIHGAKLADVRGKLAHGRSFLVAQTVMILVLLLGWHYRMWPALAILAFVPVLMRGFAWFVRGAEALRVHRLGITELTHALVFGAVVIAGFCWS